MQEGGREVEAVVDADITDAGFDGEAIQVAAAFEGDIFEADGFIAKGWQIDI